MAHMDCSSPAKYPMSPGRSRSGLRSVTPKKSTSNDVNDVSSMIQSPTKIILPSLTVDLVKLDLSSVLTKSLSIRRPPIVIIFEDFECFNSQVLQDYVTVCGLAAIFINYCVYIGPFMCCFVISACLIAFVCHFLF